MKLPEVVLVTPSTTEEFLDSLQDEGGLNGYPLRLELVQSPTGGLEPSGRRGSCLIPGKLLRG